MIRKALLIFSLLSSIASSNIVAQDEFKREWNIGASFGVNLSQANFATSVKNSPFKTKLWMQYQGGVSVRYITEKHLGFIIEANYSQQGWQQSFEDKDATPEEAEILAGFAHQHQLNYLEVPFLTHIYFGGNKVRIFLNLGPKIGILLNESEKFNNSLIEHLATGNLPQSFETAQYFKKADRKLDYGIMFGLGMELRTGVGNFALEGRYVYGLGDFYTNSKADHFQRSANRVIGLKMTYYIKLF